MQFQDFQDRLVFSGQENFQEFQDKWEACS